jgi:hypothetical protein
MRTRIDRSIVYPKTSDAGTQRSSLDLLLGVGHHGHHGTRVLCPDARLQVLGIRLPRHPAVSKVPPIPRRRPTGMYACRDDRSSVPGTSVGVTTSSCRSSA